MNTPHLKVLLGALAALAIAAVGFGKPPTQQEAFDYAKTVVFVKRVVQDNQIHSYVKEVWRFDADAGTPPAIGSEFGDPIPLNPQMKYPERDMIIFRFGQKAPNGLPNGWSTQVLENGMVMPFDMHVDDLRKALKKTQPRV